jgi:subtilisin family serine protease
MIKLFSKQILVLFEKKSKQILAKNIANAIDAGIWPESRSFSDHGYGPIPSRWKGVCQLGQAWEGTNCSRKIIGARYYAAGLDKADQEMNYMSARDINGHGTHTASTAAGAVVEGISLHGLGVGVARGGAPRARIAVYKVAWQTTKSVQLASAAVLAALDDAIHDRVDILSLSIRLNDDSFASLHAVQKGITLVYAAGNSGPRPQVIFNTAPWVITVAATKIDRSFPTAITLGNNQTLVVYTRET